MIFPSLDLSLFVLELNVLSFVIGFPIFCPLLPLQQLAIDV
jgi:hypothetical protein